MTPKKKAKELFDKFYPYVMMAGYYYEATEEGDIQNAKECTLIAVDEILDNNLWFNDEINNNYWLEVKQEIDNL